MILRKSLRDGLVVVGLRTLFFSGMLAIVCLTKDEELKKGFGYLLWILHGLEWNPFQGLDQYIPNIGNVYNDLRVFVIWELLRSAEIFVVGVLFSLPFRALSAWKQRCREWREWEREFKR